MKINNILVPTDFSENANAAMAYAVEFANHYKAAVHLLHVCHGDFSVPVPTALAHQMLDVRKNEAQYQLNLLVQQCKNDRIISHVELGLPGDVIIDYCNRPDADFDLVILGAVGDNDLQQLIFGSVTKQVMRHAKCPVMIIPVSSKFTKVNQICYATDLHHDNEDSLGNVLSFQKILGAKLNCVHISPYDAPLESAEVLFKHHLKSLNSEVNLIAIENKKVTKGLVDYVKQYAPDLLMMLRPPKSVLNRFFHQSITEQVVNKLNIPLLIFK